MTRAFVDLVQDYIDLRRALGNRLASESVRLLDFGRFLDRVGHRGPITIDLALRWARPPRSKDPVNTAIRLGTIRGFLRHRAGFDPANEVPPPWLCRRGPRRKPPHIYSDAEITALLRAAAELNPHKGLRPHSYVTLFALLVSTGVRVSEALHLTPRDVDLDARVLTVRHSKFGKSRLVPFHPSACGPLRRYAAHRDRGRAGSTPFFFATDRAPQLTYEAVKSTFETLRRRLGWTAEGRARRPRLRDMRHTFAVRRLLRWHAQRIDGDRKIAHLATYLGHVEVRDTYWYLSLAPELAALTTQRFEDFAKYGGERP
jgi:integrase